MTPNRWVTRITQIPALLRARLALLRVRAIERRQALAPATRRQNARYLRRQALEFPVPPEHLIAQVAGSADVRWFLEGGRLALDSIRETLAWHGRDVGALAAILDFGCGCGRVTRHWPGVTRATLNGVDYNAELIGWCQRQLPFGRFAVNRLAPPLDFPDGAFDLIYALSVFTHLPESMQQAWVVEFARVLKPGGLLLVTTHGEYYRPQLTPEERRAFDAGALVTRDELVAGTNLCTTFHPPRYIREILPRGLVLLEHVPMGALGNPHQDIVLLEMQAQQA
jgi:SAM-dependent methyltransferase